MLENLIIRRLAVGPDVLNASAVGCLEVELISMGGINQRLHCLLIEADIRPSH